MEIEFYSPSPPGSSGELMAKFFCNLLNESHPWLRASYKCIPVPDSVNLIDEFEPEKKKHTLLFCPSTDFILARKGSGPPKHKYYREHPDLMFAGTIGRTGRTFITPFPEIAEDPQKLDGRTVGLINSMDGDHWGSPMILSLSILRDAWGIYDEVKMIQVGIPDLNDAFENGKVAAAFLGVVDICSGKLNIGEALSAFLKRKPCYWIPLFQTDVAKINAANDFKIGLMSIPKSSLVTPGMEIKTVNRHEDFTLADFCVALAAWEDTEEEVVYELLKFIVDKAAEFAEAKINISTDLETLPRFPGLTKDQIHHGALRYFQEKGVAIDSQ